MKINNSENMFKFNRAMLRNSVSIALVLAMTPLIFAAGARAGKRRCGWMSDGDYKIAGTCVVDRSVGGCNQASLGAVCGVKYQVRTCFDGGTEYCSTAWPIFGGNCRGRQEIELHCNTAAGWPSEEDRICVCN